MSRFGVIGFLLATTVASAGPYIVPGDVALRHDLQLLADAGIITSPMSSWPLAWGPVLDDLRHVEDVQALRSDVRNAYIRVREEGDWATRVDETHLKARLAGTDDPAPIRSFQATPREQGVAELGFDWTGERLSIGLVAGAVLDPSDDETLRPDGSYVSAAIGNMTVSVSTLDRWWGPGWDSSLVLSNNARPFPAIVLDRNYTTPFESKWLHWLGSWDMSLIWGLLNDDRAVDNAQFLGFRFTFRPLRSLEIGIGRTAQWCGKGRPCGFGTLWDLIIGHDNRGPALSVQDEPSNQTASFDFRWSLSRLKLPLAVYAQFMAEDEAGGFPSRFIGQFGLDFNGRLGQNWSWRAYLEGADTTCAFNTTKPIYNCAYDHFIYQSGYRYHGRVIGAGVDNDARVATLGFVLVAADGDSWQGYVRSGRLNRGGTMDPANSLTPLPQDVLNVEVSYSRIFRYGLLEFGLGYDRFHGNSEATSSNGARGFIQWRSDY